MPNYKRNSARAQLFTREEESSLVAVVEAAVVACVAGALVDTVDRTVVAIVEGTIVACVEIRLLAVIESIFPPGRIRLGCSEYGCS